MNSGNKNLISQQFADLTFNILGMANAYTGANFSNPPSKDDAIILKTCSEFVLNHFPQLAINEIEEAFALAASGKLGDLNFETYYGKFSVNILGKVLKAYLSLRRKIVMDFENVLRAVEKEIEFKKSIQKNEEVRKGVIESYLKLKQDFEKNGDIDAMSSQVHSYWGRILVEEGVINFSSEEKKQIYEESKQLVEKEIRKSIQESKIKNEVKHLRTIIKEIDSGFHSEKAEAKYLTKYSKLIVIKSILNTQ